MPRVLTEWVSISGKGATRQQPQLANRVGAGNIGARILLGKALGLGFGYRLLPSASGGDAVEDVVAGAVQHAGERDDAAIVGQRAYRFQCGNRAAHGRRVAKIVEAFQPRISGQQQLVGRNHKLARRQRCVNQIACRIAAADQFDHDVDAVNHVPTVAGQQIRGGVIDVQLRPPHRDAGYLKQVRMFPQLLEHSQPDRAQAEQPDLQRSRCKPVLAARVERWLPTVVA